MAEFVVFVLDELRYALHLACVERIVRTVEVTPLLEAPEIVPGIINVRGDIIPVVDIRKRFRLSERETDLDDQIMICRTPKRRLALPVDSVQGVVEYPQEKGVPSEKIVPGMEYIEGVLKLPDGLILIHDLEKFLSLEEEKKSVLVVEDSITARSLLKNILESAGYQVRTAVDGIDAFTSAKTEKFELVVSDVDMPMMNGFDLTARIRSDKKLAELPVVLVTALESREDRERGIDTGASAYIVKSSFDQSNLLETVRRLL